MYVTSRCNEIYIRYCICLTINYIKYKFSSGMFMMMLIHTINTPVKVYKEKKKSIVYIEMLRRA